MLLTVSLSTCYMYAKEIDELLLPQGKASSLLTDHLITGKVVQVKPSIHKSLTGLVGWFYLDHLIKLKTTKLTAFSYVFLSLQYQCWVGERKSFYGDDDMN